MNLTIDEIRYKIHAKTPLNDAEQRHQLWRFNKHKALMKSSTLNVWFIHAIEDENIPLLEAVLDHTNVPANLTLKERICYYYLLKGS